MIENLESNVNSGVQTNVGMQFQKHCTLYLFLEKYEEIKNERYFIILEHHEDIVFGYLSEKDKLKNIETFQAKKSTNKWTINDLIEIIKKIAITSQAILDDPHPKIKRFSQQNYFATNNTIELKTKINNVTHRQIINETNNIVSYNSIGQEIKDKILDGNTNIKFDDKDKPLLENLYFKYIDLSRTPKTQLDYLLGRFISVFGDSIVDHKAALDTFLFHLNKIESEFNQGNIALLTDKSKRLESVEINEILNILTTKKLAYEFWRQKGENICENLNISIFDNDSFKLHFLNSFDKFKDLNESEHRKVLSFCKGNTNVLRSHTNDTDCILSLYNDFNAKKSTTLKDVQLKSAISAAYLEIKNTL